MISPSVRISGPATRDGSLGPPAPPVMMAAAFRIRILMSSRSKFAFVPAAQPDARHPCRDAEQHHASYRDQEQRSEEPRNVQLKTRLQDLIRKPRAAAARSRHELGHHRANQR